MPPAAVDIAAGSEPAATGGVAASLSSASASARRSWAQFLAPKPVTPLPGYPLGQHYALPVDEEQKATELRLLSFGRPHMRAWHLSWACLFVAFASTFTPAALLPVLGDDLGLTGNLASIAALASVAGAIPVRLGAGRLVDMVGPRSASALLLLGTAPATFCLAAVRGAVGLVVTRLVIGISLGQFCVSQAWVRAMFSARCLGTATALSAGWGNAGGGAALLLLPLLVQGLRSVMPSSLAWRIAVLAPALLQLAVGLLVLLASDDAPGDLSGSSGARCRFPCFQRSSAPEATSSRSSTDAVLVVQEDGQQAAAALAAAEDPPGGSARVTGASQPGSNCAAAADARQSPRAVCQPGLQALDSSPAYTAGSSSRSAAAATPQLSTPPPQLAPAQPHPPQQRRQHRHHQEGHASQLFQGLQPQQQQLEMQFQAVRWPATHPLHGSAPDTRVCKPGWSAALRNPRTYLLGVAYALCFGVELVVHNALVKYLYDTFHLPLLTAGAMAGAFGLINVVTRVAGGWASDMVARACGMRGRLWVLWLTLLMSGTGSLVLGASHTSLGASVATLALFSAFTQAACGAVFAVVPFVSVRANGLVTGVVAAMGNAGALLLQLLLFGGVDLGIPVYYGFYWMGVVVLVGSVTTWALYFPPWGGMWCGPRAGASEEAYYLAEFSPRERAAGTHLTSLAFAFEARANRASPAAAGATPLPQAAPH